jgi:NADP-dependent 3-hydroxy acid dehydrogenase YdfG
VIDMAGRLDGTAALVTGASSGIGEATAQALAEQGAAVAVVARRADRLRRVADDIEVKGGTALVLEADVTDQEQVNSAVERTVGELGRLDVVVNNAGLMLLGPIVGAPTEEWDRMVALNVQGLLYVTNAALPHLLRAADDNPRHVADLVNISSVAGRRASPGAGVYDLTKFGVAGFSESLRAEIGKRHVRVAVVEPGVVRTELASHVREEVREEQLAPFSGFEPLESKDIAEAILFIVTRPRRVNVNEAMVRPTEQAF